MENQQAAAMRIHQKRQAGLPSTVTFVSEVVLEQDRSRHRARAFISAARC